MLLKNLDGSITVLLRISAQSFNSREIWKVVRAGDQKQGLVGVQNGEWRGAWKEESLFFHSSWKTIQLWIISDEHYLYQQGHMSSLV